MNIFNPLDHDQGDTRGFSGGALHKAHSFLRRNTRWLLMVMLPTVFVAFYFYLIAAPQYESEAHILVRNTQSGSQLSPGAGQALSMLGGGSGGSISASDTASIADYLDSHDAVDALRRDYDLVNRFRRPESDIFSRLTPANPTPERLLRYFGRRADIKTDNETGIIAIKVRSFRPSDSFDLVSALTKLGEDRVNLLNKRSYNSALTLSARALAEAEAAVGASSKALTTFRQGKRSIDPVATGQAQIGVVSTLQTSLIEAKAQQSAMIGAINADSPQARAVRARVAALTQQLANEQRRLAGGSTAIAANVGDYQNLQLQQQFAAKRYDDAAASYQRARTQIEKQQLFVVRVVNPNMPVKALFPQAFKITLTVFAALTLLYAIGWLIAAGVREHAA